MSANLPAEPLRVGLIGAGGLGTSLGESTVELSDARLVAIADVSDEARSDAAATLGVPDGGLYADHETMLDGESPDAVIIATPHTTHYEQIRAALDRELHVLCEKPMVTDTRQARDLVDRADRTDAVMAIGWQRHITPEYLALRDRLRGADIDCITGVLTQNWEAFSGSWRFDPALSGGGFLYDSGSHLLEAILWSADLTPEAVSADMTYFDDEQRVDERSIVTTWFEGGAVASLTFHGSAPTWTERVRVWDDDGAVALEDGDLEVLDEGGEKRDVDLDRYADVPDSKPAAFLEAIRTGDSLLATVGDGLRTTATIDAIYEAARTGERVPVDLE